MASSRRERNRDKNTAPVEMKIETQDLVPYASMAMKKMGEYTLEQRAVIDYRDGLKPVQRRALYAAHMLGLTADKGIVKKSARIVGDTIGKYHPHGDQACYGAIVTMTAMNNPMVHGSGNWGTLIDDAAAYRYTEMRLSAYSDATFFEYAPVIETVLNFDASEREPLYLPSTLPNLLLNGAFGIAMGTTIGIPAFEKAGVLALVKRAISGEKITVKDCMKHLVPTCAEGGTAYLEEQSYKDELKSFYETGIGSLYWEPEWDLDVDRRSIKITGFAPQVAIGLATVLDNKFDPSVKTKDGRPRVPLPIALDIETIDDLSYPDEVTGKTRLAYEIFLKKSVPKEDVKEALHEIVDCFAGTQRLSFAINVRERNELDESEVSFFPTNMVDFIAKWAEYRIALERRMIDYLMARVQQRLDRDELLLFAVLNREVIIRALDRSDTEAYLAKTLKVTLAYVDQLLDLKVRQLKALDEKPIRERIRGHNAELKALRADHKDPVKRIHAAIDTAAEAAA